MTKRTDILRARRAAAEAAAAAEAEAAEALASPAAKVPVPVLDDEDNVQEVCVPRTLEDLLPWETVLSLQNDENEPLEESLKETEEPQEPVAAAAAPRVGALARILDDEDEEEDVPVTRTRDDSQELDEVAAASLAAMQAQVLGDEDEVQEVPVTCTHEDSQEPDAVAAVSPAAAPAQELDEEDEDQEVPVTRKHEDYPPRVERPPSPQNDKLLPDKVAVEENPHEPKDTVLKSAPIAGDEALLKDVPSKKGASSPAAVHMTAPGRVSASAPATPPANLPVVPVMLPSTGDPLRDKTVGLLAKTLDVEGADGLHSRGARSGGSDVLPNG